MPSSTQPSASPDFVDEMPRSAIRRFERHRQLSFLPRVVCCIGSWDITWRNSRRKDGALSMLVRTQAFADNLWKPLIMMDKPVIAIAGLGCETSTFSPARTHAPAFQPRRGQDIIEKYPFLHLGTPLDGVAKWKGALIGHALPGGIVTRGAFEELADELIRRLKAITILTKIQGLWYDIHGAMCVEGLDDVESELLRRIRAVISPEVIISTSMDLHGNVSQDLVHGTDLITCYRMAPHEDAWDTKRTRMVGTLSSS